LFHVDFLSAFSSSLFVSLLSFHYPVSGKLLRRYLIPGEYHTVSPIAVRKDVNVYTENKRVVCPIDTEEFGLVLLIAIAATMVGSIIFDCTCNPKPLDGKCCEDGRCQIGKNVKKFQDCGAFAFGGSTTLVLFQPGAIIFDNDLITNSENQLETLVKVGNSLGRSTGKYKKQQ
jgi:phosphatidylserine decarboxylase